MKSPVRPVSGSQTAKLSRRRAGKPLGPSKTQLNGQKIDFRAAERILTRARRRICQKKQQNPLPTAFRPVSGSQTAKLTRRRGRSLPKPRKTGIKRDANRELELTELKEGRKQSVFRQQMCDVGNSIKNPPCTSSPSRKERVGMHLNLLNAKPTTQHNPEAQTPTPHHNAQKN